MDATNRIRLILGIPKSIYINFKCFKFKDAIKFPILVSNKTKICRLRGKIKINNKVKTGMIQIGLGGSGTHCYYPTVLELNGDVICDGILRIGGGSNIVTVNENSIIKFGDNVIFTGGVTLISRKSITIGKGSLISWDTQIMDTDFHKILKDGEIINLDKGIVIGENVWIGSRCNILKGSKIDNNNVIASGSEIYADINGEKQVVTGNPIKVLKSNIIWKV